MRAITNLTKTIYTTIQTEPIRAISVTTAGLVAALGLGSLALSYNALRGLAADNGLAGWQSYLWPILIDVALIVFSLAVVRNSLRAERVWWPWALVGVYTLGTIAFNLLHAQAQLGAILVAVVAPVSLFLSFETLMGMLKSDIRRAAVIRGLADLDRERGKLAGEVERLQARIEQARRELAAARSEKRQASYTGGVSDETRARAAALLADNPDLSGGELGRLLDRSASTGRRLRRELLPELESYAHPVGVNGSGAGTNGAGGA